MTTKTSKRSARRPPDGERGASAVELAILFPLLIALILGIAEFGWMMDQRQDIRHNAHDAARLAALDFGGSQGQTGEELVTFLCDRFDLYDDAEVEITLDSGTDKGDVVMIYLGQEMEQLTGMFGQLFGGKLVQSTASSVLEVDVNFGETTETCGDARNA